MAGRSPFLVQRQERMAKIRRIVETACPIDYNKILGMIEVQFGLKMATAASYLNALIRAGYVSKDQHNVLTVSKGDSATKQGAEKSGT